MGISITNFEGSVYYLEYKWGSMWLPLEMMDRSLWGKEVYDHSGECQVPEARPFSGSGECFQRLGIHGTFALGDVDAALGRMLPQPFELRIVTFKISNELSYSSPFKIDESSVTVWYVGQVWGDGMPQVDMVRFPDELDEFVAQLFDGPLPEEYTEWVRAGRRDVLEIHGDEFQLTIGSQDV